MREWAVRAATFIAVAVAILPRLNWVLPNEDGGVIGAWAMQAAAGEMPYRDFFVFTGPASVAVVAATFKVVGPGYLVARAVSAAGVLAGCAALYGIARKLLPRGWSAAVTVLWGAWLGVFFQYGQHHFLGTACLLWMGLAVLSRRFVLAGVAGSLAVAFIQSAASAVLLGLAAAYLVEPAWRRSLVPMAAAGAAATVPWVAWLGLAGAMPAFWDDAVVFLLRSYSTANALPFPWLPTQLRDSITFESNAAGVWMLLFGWFASVAAPAVIAVAAAWRLVRMRGRVGPDPWVPIAVLSTGLFASVVAARLTAPLGWFAAPLALVLVAARIRALAAGRLVALVPAAAVAVVGLSPAPLGYALSCEVNGHSSWVLVSTPGGPLCIHATFAAPMEGALNFVATHPGERVAFLPVASSFPLFTGETPPVSTVWVIPGLETPRQLAALDADMTTGRARYVVYYEADLRPALPADAALFEPGSSIFDRLLARHYRRVEGADVGGSALWEWTG